MSGEDAEAATRSGAIVIAINSTAYLAPHADIFFAADQGWWQQHIHRLPSGPQRWTASSAAAQEFGLHLLTTTAAWCNSGGAAINLAVEMAARRVILLGYDCSLRDGVHWHGLHATTENPDVQTVTRWHAQFEAVAEKAAAAGTQVYNASRYTELHCFPRVEFSDILPELGERADCRSALLGSYNMANPLFMRDASGYCYRTTPHLLMRDDMTPWNGEVDSKGYAVDSDPTSFSTDASVEVTPPPVVDEARPVRKPRGRSRAAKNVSFEVGDGQPE